MLFIDVFVGDVAQLTSPVFNPTTETSQCHFIFYLHMTDQIESGGLYVYSRTEDGGPLTLLWKRSDSTFNSFTR